MHDFLAKVGCWLEEEECLSPKWMSPALENVPAGMAVPVFHRNLPLHAINFLTDMRRKLPELMGIDGDFFCLFLCLTLMEADRKAGAIVVD